MKVSPERLDKIIWTLIFGGLLVLCLGLFVQRQSDGLGWTLLVGGGVAAALGAALVGVRSRMGD
jgi:hypothetical protein